jgi:hypothetical protein
VVTISGIFILALVASMRLNRLATTDTITQPIRNTLGDRSGRISRFLSALLDCPWCTGMYTAFACAAYAHWLTGVTWAALPVTGLAIAYLAPLLADWFEDGPTHPYIDPDETTGKD